MKYFGFRDQSRRGVTLVEAVITVGIIGILLAVAVPSLSGLLERSRVVAAADEVAGLLNYAKAETNATNATLIVRFDPDPGNAMSCAMVVTSLGFNRCRCYLPPDSVCPSTTQRSLRLFQLPKTHVKFDASATSWAGSAYNIRVRREQMTIDTEGFKVDVVGLKHGAALRVEFGAGGRIKICAPSGDMAGYARCA